MIVSLGSTEQISGREYRPDTPLSQTLSLHVVVQNNLYCRSRTNLKMSKHKVFGESDSEEYDDLEGKDEEEKNSGRN